MRPRWLGGRASPSPDAAARKTVAYARVPCHEHSMDLARQIADLDAYCAKQGWIYEVIIDSGLRPASHGSRLRRALGISIPMAHFRLMEAVLSGRVERVVLCGEHVLPPLGAGIFLSLCRREKVGVVLLDHMANPGIKRRKTVSGMEYLIEVACAYQANSSGRKIP